MRRFFVALFIISLCAAGGTWYWKTYYPEGARVAFDDAPAARGVERSFRSPSTREMMQPRPSNRQDLAVTVSILSSLVSALAAVA
jgi:hypothetical protein